MSILMLAVCIGLVCAWFARKTKLLSKGKGKNVVLHPEAQNIITFDTDKIAVTYPNGEIRSVCWSDLTMIGIRTTDEGPFVADVFWGLHGPDKAPEVVYPQGATGEQELLAELQRRVPDLDNRKLIEAMGCTDNAFFLLWEKTNKSLQATA
jgi:hypothetical protein